MGPLAIPLEALLWLRIARGFEAIGQRDGGAYEYAARHIRRANPEWWPTVEA